MIVEEDVGGEVVVEGGILKENVFAENVVEELVEVYVVNKEDIDGVFEVDENEIVSEVDVVEDDIVEGGVEGGVEEAKVVVDVVGVGAVGVDVVEDDIGEGGVEEAIVEVDINVVGVDVVPVGVVGVDGVEDNIVEAVIFSKAPAENI